MAYRRKQGGLSRSSTFKVEIPARDLDNIITSSSSSTAPSSPLARRTTTNANSPSSHSPRLHSSPSFKDRSSSSGSPTYDYTLMRSSNEAGGFWGVIARKAKSILDDRQQPISPTSPNYKPHSPFSPTSNHQSIQYQYECYSKKFDTPTSRNGVVDTSFTLHQIGHTIGNALEEAGKKSEDKIEETSATGGKWKVSAFDDDEEKEKEKEKEKDNGTGIGIGDEPNKEITQLKATRHVAIATADKAKKLLRELKSVKADLAVAIQRCSQLEEENKILREKGADSPTEDDMIRDQLETLLAEKGVLAHENSVYARENRYLREIVEFHHLSTMQHHHMLISFQQLTQP